MAPDDFDAHFTFARFSKNLNRQKEALASYTRSLDLARKAGNQPNVAMTLNNLGVLHSDENRMADARKAYEEALKIYQQFAKKSPARYERDVERVRRLLDGLKK